jgi:hypothetical protein
MFKKYIFNGLIWKRYVLPIILIYAATAALVASIKVLLSLNTADTLSLAQLILTMLLLPTVVLGFTYTVLTFKEAHELPDLDMFWLTETGAYQTDLTFDVSPWCWVDEESTVLEYQGKLINKNQHKSVAQAALKSIPGVYPPTIRMVLLNKGNAIAVWYVVSLRIQFDPISSFGENRFKVAHKYPDSTIIISSALTLNREWEGAETTEPDQWQMNTAEKDSIVATFMSNGKLALYPYYPLHFFSLQTDLFPVYKDGSSSKAYNIPYTIITDRGQKKQGTLKITFQRDTK